MILKAVFEFGVRELGCFDDLRNVEIRMTGVVLTYQTFNKVNTITYTIYVKRNQRRFNKNDRNRFSSDFRKPILITICIYIQIRSLTITVTIQTKNKKNRTIIVGRV